MALISTYWWSTGKVRYHTIVGNQDWETPNELFLPLDRHFNFTIDAAADPFSNKVDRFLMYHSETDNALTTHLEEEIIFCNPPYANMLPWAEQFVRWSRHNTVVALVQDRTDTMWFSLLWDYSGIVRFLTPRVQFVELSGKQNNNRGSTIFCLGQDLPSPSNRWVDIWKWKKGHW